MGPCDKSNSDVRGKVGVKHTTLWVQQLITFIYWVSTENACRWGRASLLPPVHVQEGWTNTGHQAGIWSTSSQKVPYGEPTRDPSPAVASGRESCSPSSLSQPAAYSYSLGHRRGPDKMGERAWVFSSLTLTPVNMRFLPVCSLPAAAPVKAIP